MQPASVALETLAGWAEDDHGAALDAYRITADLLPDHWPRPAKGCDAKAFFQCGFAGRVLGTPPALITGYYEPEVEGRAAREPGFAHALYAMPASHAPGEVWHDRAAIEAGDLLAGQDIVWLRSAIEAFMAQVQGSVRVRLGDGAVLRLGFAGRNGHPYRSIGAGLIARGAIAESAMSAPAIRDWCADHPGQVADLLRHNPSFVFFQVLDLAQASGPLGAMGQPVTAGRSLAVDPNYHPLGAPIWVDGLSRLMVAQDTGSAIKGAQRGDVFAGSGAAAGAQAGAMRLSGRMVTLWPLAEPRP